MSLISGVISAVDIIGAILMIAFAFMSLRLAMRLVRREPHNIIHAYLMWICIAMAVFAVSRSAVHIIRQSLDLVGNAGAWQFIGPYSGAVNTFTLIVVGAVTLFFEYTWSIYRQILSDKQILQATRGELMDLNENLERRVDERTRALADSERKYREVFEVSRDMILLSDLEGRIFALNPAGYEILGGAADVSAAHIEYCQDFLFRGKDDWKKIVTVIRRRQWLPDMEFDMVNARGEKRRILLSASLVPGPRNDEGRIYFLIKDIEKRRMIKEQMARADKLASIGELSAGIAHEINNPLGIILGYAQLMLREESIPSQRSEDLKTIERHVRTCKVIVEDLLNFARVSPAKKEMNDIHGLIDDVIKFTYYDSGFDRVVIEKDYDPDVKPLFIDEKKIKQVFVNLIVNAKYAMGEKGSIKISTCLNEPDKRVEVRVSDTGCGISEQDMLKIFDPFFTTKPTGVGTGLGLSVSYGIVKNHGGDIQVKSEPGAGAVFTVLLPLEPHHEHIIGWEK
ncbi:MAG: PAS domain S-box protein [Deltaproteobacteria bacterium]|nr:PAS domain S-box protein [Deltaproteobacteria bacterium]